MIPGSSLVILNVGVSANNSNSVLRSNFHENAYTSLEEVLKSLFFQRWMLWRYDVIAIMWISEQQQQQQQQQQQHNNNNNITIYYQNNNAKPI
jgi:hypothetical protein